MKVKAIKQGHYGTLREEGEVFELKDIQYKGDDGKPKVYSKEDQFSPEWMMKFSGKKPSKRDVEEDEPEHVESDSDSDVI